MDWIVIAEEKRYFAMSILKLLSSNVDSVSHKDMFHSVKYDE
jgi:hypothetical protein